jgi:type III pantothenate kinase
MFLTVDIGNTTTRFGVFQGKTLRKTWIVKTADLNIWKPDKKIMQIKTIIASVVPKADKVLRKKLPQVVFIKPGRFKRMRIRIRNRKEVGADRVVNAYAAWKLYGAPAIVVDFGTATTFDIISKKGEYLGGAIAPGILLTRDVLHERTAKLPRIEIQAPRKIIGDSTKEAMRSGLLYGYVALVEGMLSRFKKVLGPRRARSSRPRSYVRVVGTGGLAKLIGKYAKGIDIIDQDLTLKGLREIANELGIQ